VISVPRRWAAAALLVTVGWLVTPQAVPVYDGIGAPDEPYRYVVTPPGSPKTAAPTEGAATSPVTAGKNSSGMSVQTAEQGPQASLFVPQLALATTGSSIKVSISPKAPDTQPPGGLINGNVYAVTFSAPATLTDRAAIATLLLRATTAVQPGPVAEHRATPADPWKQLQTSRGGQDSYVASFVGPGEYALAFLTSAKGKATGGSSGLLYVGGGVLALLVVVVVVIRVRGGVSATA
jgi:hypothetical protein